jgi:hypothetical protein
LIEEGIPYETVEALIPQLYRHYDRELKPWPESHRDFQESWEDAINSFKDDRGQWRKKDD